MTSTEANDNGRDAARVGLTGGIACGKSTVADCFAELGVTIIDTDVIAREVVAADSPALADIAAVFGPGVLAKDGSLNRSMMREIVFSDDLKRQQLEAILHPRIRDAAWQQARTAAGPYVIVVVPLLFKSPMKKDMDRILVVDCSTATQMQRLLARDNESEEQARRMIAAQASRADRLSLADDIVVNEGSLGETREQVMELHERYLEIFA